MREPVHNQEMHESVRHNPILPVFRIAQWEWVRLQKQSHILTSETLRASIIRRTMADVWSYTPATVPTRQITHSFRKQTKNGRLLFLLITLCVLSLPPLSSLLSSPRLSVALWYSMSSTIINRPIYTETFLDTHHCQQIHFCFMLDIWFGYFGLCSLMLGRCCTLLDTNNLTAAHSVQTFRVPMHIMHTKQFA